MAHFASPPTQSEVSGSSLHSLPFSLEHLETPDPVVADRKSTRLNSSHTVIYTLSLHDALPIYGPFRIATHSIGSFRILATFAAVFSRASGDARSRCRRSEERRVGKEGRVR